MPDYTYKLEERVIIPGGGGMPGAMGGMVASEPQQEGFYWLDMVVLGNHLPQMYRPHEFVEATPERARAYGLCEDCLGYGSTEPVRLEAANIGDVRTPCGRCEATGREFVRVYRKKVKDGVQMAVQILAHAPQLADESEGWGEDLCLRCLSRVSDPNGQHVLD